MRLKPGYIAALVAGAVPTGFYFRIVSACDFERGFRYPVLVCAAAVINSYGIIAKVQLNRHFFVVFHWARFQLRESDLRLTAAFFGRNDIEGGKGSQFAVPVKAKGVFIRIDAYCACILRIY